MDLSPEYIKMCEKAQEIQGLVIPLNIRKPNYQSQCGADMSESGDWWHLNTWLPRQDQLQAMITPYNLWSNTLAFEFFLRKEGKYDINSYPYQFTSMEQLWLAFLMQSLYQKYWDKEKEQWTKK